MIENLKIALRKQQKLIAPFLLTIFLPSALLSFFGIRAIRNGHFRLMKQVEIEQGQAADFCKLQLRSRVKTVESLLHTLAQDPSFAGADEDAKRRLLRDQLAEDRLVELVFIIYNDDAPVYPLFQSHPENRSSRASPFLGGTEQLKLKKAEELEFVQKDYGDAVTVYNQILSATRNRNDQALLLSHLARNQSKLKEYRHAIYSGMPPIKSQRYR